MVGRRTSSCATPEGVAVRVERLIRGQSLQVGSPFYEADDGVCFFSRVRPEGSTRAGVEHEILVSTGFPPDPEAIRGISFWMWVAGEQRWQLRHLGETDARGALRYLPEPGRGYRLAATVPSAKGIHQVLIPDTDETLDLRVDHGRLQPDCGRQLIRMAKDWYQVLGPPPARKGPGGRYIFAPRLSGASGAGWVTEEERDVAWHQTPLDHRRWYFSFREAPFGLARAMLRTADGLVARNLFFPLTRHSTGTGWSGGLFLRGAETWSEIEVEPVTSELVEDLSPEEREDFTGQLDSLILSRGDHPVDEHPTRKLRDLWQPLIDKAGRARIKE